MYDTLTLKKYINNIEELAADARYYNDYGKYEKVKIELESIIHWASKGKKLIDKEIKNANNKEE